MYSKREKKTMKARGDGLKKQVQRKQQKGRSKYLAVIHCKKQKSLIARPSCKTTK